MHRQDETVIEEIPVKSSQSIVEATNTIISSSVAWRELYESTWRSASAGNFPVLHAVYSWILRHSGWLLNRFCIGKDGYTARDTRARSTMARYAISSSACCSRCPLRRRQSWTTDSDLVFGSARQREGTTA